MILYIVLSLILAILLLIRSKEYKNIRCQYFELLQNDSNFISFVKDTIDRVSDEAQCIKIINKKYHIGILDAKKMIEKVKYKSDI